MDLDAQLGPLCVWLKRVLSGPDLAGCTCRCRGIYLDLAAPGLYRVSRHRHGLIHPCVSLCSTLFYLTLTIPAGFHPVRYTVPSDCVSFISKCHTVRVGYTLSSYD
jgi:hypothetical protein